VLKEYYYTISWWSLYITIVKVYNGICGYHMVGKKME